MLNPKPKNKGIYDKLFLRVIFLLAILIIGIFAVIAWSTLVNVQKQPQSSRDQTLPDKSQDAYQFKSTTINNFANWKTYRNDKFGFGLKYPDTWQDQGRDIEIKNYFIVNPQIGVFSISLMKRTDDLSLSEVARRNVAKNNCPPYDDQPGDHMIRSDKFGVLYVLYCSVTSEDYIYLFKNASGDVIELDYHDDFKEDWNENKKITVFDKIISTISLIP